jgi:hypothetical protein
MFWFFKITVLSDTGQIHSDLDDTTRMHKHTIRMDTNKIRRALINIHNPSFTF